MQQRPGVPQVSSTTVLIDVPYIYKHHDGFKAETEQMNSELQRLQEQFKREAEEIRSFQEKLGQFRPGTPDYKAAQDEYNRRVADFQVRQQTAKQDVGSRRAQIFNRVYLEILQEVEYYCANNNIALALNFNGDVINPDRPQAVERMLSEPVVYHAKSIDITPFILQTIRARKGWDNRQAESTAGRA